MIFYKTSYSAPKANLVCAEIRTIIIPQKIKVFIDKPERKTHEKTCHSEKKRESDD